MNSQDQLASRVKTSMNVFYRRYYRDQLGLVDWEARVENRLNEESWLGEPQVSRVEDWRNLSFKGMKVLVVGAGTGAESVVLHQRGGEVHGIEPDADAIAILQMKSELHGIPADRFQKAKAEEMPYEDNVFDFVYCYTVLEHVQNVEASIEEMIRVCKIMGTVYIQTPDYRFPYEGHYKTFRLPFSPKWLTHLQFWLEGKPVEFLKSINFVNPQMLDRCFLSVGLEAVKVTRQEYTEEIGETSISWFSLWPMICSKIFRNQNIFVQKLAPL